MEFLCHLKNAGCVSFHYFLIPSCWFLRSEKEHRRVVDIMHLILLEMQKFDQNFIILIADMQK